METITIKDGELWAERTPIPAGTYRIAARDFGRQRNIAVLKDVARPRHRAFHVHNFKVREIEKRGKDEHIRNTQ